MARPPILNRLFGTPAHEKAAQSLYLALVEQARQTGFFSRWGVPDTLDGRFDMIVLHAALVIRRIKHGPGEVSQADRDQLTQSLFDYMFNDMDRSLREMGVTDLGVGKRVRQMASAFYGRADAYQSALNHKDVPALTAAIEKNVYRGQEPGAEQVAQLTQYVGQTAQALEDQPIGSLMAGTIRFPGLGD